MLHTPKKYIFIGVIALLCVTGTANAQDTFSDKSPAAAMARSFVVPGWGQYYVDQSNWSRGKIHLLADVMLISSYFGIHLNTGRLEANRNTFALNHAGIDLREYSRNVRIYVGDFNSLQDFNDFQERTRNWNLIIDQSQGIDWSWDNESRRNQFTAMNSRIDQQKQQLPAILTLMLVNRVIAGVHAYTKAMDYGSSAISVTVTPSQWSNTAYQANLRINF